MLSIDLGVIDLTFVLLVFVIDFEDFLDEAPLAEKGDKGLVANECYPRMPANAPSHPEYFALLNQDPTVALLNAALWAGTIPVGMTNGLNPPFNKRDLLDLWYDNGNETRRATSEEAEAAAREMMLRARLQELEEESLGYVDCIGDSCATQITPAKRLEVASKVHSRFQRIRDTANTGFEQTNCYYSRIDYDCTARR